MTKCAVRCVGCILGVTRHYQINILYLPHVNFTLVFWQKKKFKPIRTLRYNYYHNIAKLENIAKAFKVKIKTISIKKKHSRESGIKITRTIFLKKKK